MTILKSNRSPLSTRNGGVAKGTVRFGNNEKTMVGERLFRGCSKCELYAPKNCFRLLYVEKRNGCTDFMVIFRIVFSAPLSKLSGKKNRVADYAQRSGRLKQRRRGETRRRKRPPMCFSLRHSNVKIKTKNNKNEKEKKTTNY